MKAVISEARHVRIASLFYDERAEDMEPFSADLEYHFFSKEERGVHVATYMVDLTKPEGSLLAAMHRATRYDIRTAEERDHLAFSVWDRHDQEVGEAFARDYADFARQHPSWPVQQRKAPDLRPYAVAESLLITRTRAADGTVMSWHVYVRRRSTARLVHSISARFAFPDRQMSARANRWHHWMDLKSLKEAEYDRCDLGGTPLPGSPLRGIGAFKAGFGGELVHGFHWARPTSLRGATYCLARDAAARIRGLRAAQDR